MAKFRFVTFAGALVLSSALVSGIVFAKQKKHEPDFIPGQYVVELRHPLASFETNALERALGGRIIMQVRDNMVVVQRDSREAKSKALRALQGNAIIKIADPNWIMRTSKTPNDPEFGKLWGLSNDGGIDAHGGRGVKGVDIGAVKAWDKTTGSKSVVVGIIDTGVDFKIPDLADNAWTNEKEAHGLTGVDDDANGYVDDIHGYNFADEKGDSTDDQGHGSHCAGTIGARGDDGAGVAGVNWYVSIMAVKFLDSNGSGSLANAIRAIDYARKNGAQVLSNSWGGGTFAQTLFDAITETQKAGELFVAAAGNDGADSDANPAYPASYKIDNIISVAALDMRGELASFSNYGATTVHLAAPGVNVYSTAPAPLNFQFMSGTSMATPHVAGAAALLLAAEPHLTYGELKQRLMSGARPLHTLKGKTISGGMLDVSYALSGDTPPKDPNDPAVWTGTSAQSVSSPHPYGDKLNQTVTVTVPGAKRFALHFSKFEMEANYDKIEFFNQAGELIGTMSGTHSGEYSPICEGESVTLKATSDDSVNGYGFDIDSAVYEKSVGPAPGPTPEPPPVPTPTPLPTPAPVNPSPTPAP
jgi:thermitase